MKSLLAPTLCAALMAAGMLLTGTAAQGKPRPAHDASALHQELRSLEKEFGRSAHAFLADCNPTEEEEKRGQALYKALDRDVEAVVDEMRHTVEHARSPRTLKVKTELLGRAEVAVEHWLAFATEIRYRNVDGKPMNRFLAMRMAENAVRHRNGSRVTVHQRGIKDEEGGRHMDADRTLLAMTPELRGHVDRIALEATAEWRNGHDAQRKVASELEAFDLPAWPKAEK